MATAMVEGMALLMASKMEIAKMNGLVGYGNQAVTESPMQLRNRTLSERLGDKKANLETQLKDVNDTIALLDKNPEIQVVLDHLAKLNFGF